MRVQQCVRYARSLSTITYISRESSIKHPSVGIASLAQLIPTFYWHLSILLELSRALDSCTDGTKNKLTK